MNKQIVVFDTTNGDILRVYNAPPEWATVCSGDGRVDGQSLFGYGFSSIDPSDINTVSVILDGRTMRCGLKEVVSDTELTFARTPIYGDVTYNIMKRNNPMAISDTDKIREINNIKAEIKHANVDALKISVEQWIGAHSHFVDITDGNKIKRKDERIIYE
jgi:hypothetical protein